MFTDAKYFRLHACTKKHHGYRHLMSDIHKSNIWFLFSNTLRIWSGLLEVWDVSVFGLRAGGVFMSRCEGVIYGRIESMYRSVKSLDLRHHTLPFGLLKSMCTGLYQSTRKQCCVYCCSESARSVSLIHGISVLLLFLRNSKSKEIRYSQAELIIPHFFQSNFCETIIVIIGWKFRLQKLYTYLLYFHVFSLMFHQLQI